MRDVIMIQIVTIEEKPFVYVTEFVNNCSGPSDNTKLPCPHTNATTGALSIHHFSDVNFDQATSL